MNACSILTFSSIMQKALQYTFNKQNGFCIVFESLAGHFSSKLNLASHSQWHNQTIVITWLEP